MVWWLLVGVVGMLIKLSGLYIHAQPVQLFLFFYTTFSITLEANNLFLLYDLTADSSLRCEALWHIFFHIGACKRLKSAVHR